MDNIPNFKKNIETGYEGPFNIEEHLNKIRDKYQNYYNDLMEQFKKDLTDGKDECVIKLASKWTCNSSDITVDLLLKKAVENFIFDLSMKQYYSTYEQKSYRNGYDPDDYFDYNNWMELIIQLK